MQLTEDTAALALAHHRSPYPEPFVVQHPRVLVAMRAIVISPVLLLLFLVFYLKRCTSHRQRHTAGATKSDTQELHNGTSKTEFVHTVPRVEHVI